MIGTSARTIIGRDRQADAREQHGPLAAASRACAEDALVAARSRRAHVVDLAPPGLQAETLQQLLKPVAP
jgi:hypothetical protein